MTITYYDPDALEMTSFGHEFLMFHTLLKIRYDLAYV